MRQRLRCSCPRVLLALAALVLAPGASAPLDRVAKGDVVEVEQKGTWRRATVVKVAGGRPLVHYEDGDGADEWVSPLQLRAPGDPATPDAATEAAAAPDAGAKADAVSDTIHSLGVAGKALSTAKFEGARFGSVTFDRASMTGSFSFENTTGGPLSFEKLDWALLVGPNRLVGGSAGSKESVAAGARQSLSVPVELKFLAIPGLAASLARGRTKFAVEAVATMKAADGAPFAVPMRWDGELALPRLPSVSGKLELTDLGLTEIVATLHLSVDNPNAFPIPLDALKGSVSLSHFPVAALALPEPRTLEPGPTTIDLPIPIAIADVAGDVIKQLRSGKASLEVAAELKVAGKTIPFSYRSAAKRK